MRASLDYSLNDIIHSDTLNFLCWFGFKLKSILLLTQSSKKMFHIPKVVESDPESMSKLVEWDRTCDSV